MAILFAFLFYISYASARSNPFILNLTWESGSPDGGPERDLIKMNGHFTGPLLEIIQGDWVEMLVQNNMPFNTTIHAHGIEQINTPWADGVPGLSQEHIQPGGNYTYKWKAEQYGSYFYHAHSQSQIDDGCYGPILIKPKGSVSKPFSKIAPHDIALLGEAESEVRPLLISDWRHTTSQQTWDLEVASGIETSVCMDSILVNGKGYDDCWPREQLTKFTPAGFVPLLQQLGLELSVKGCLPPAVVAASFPNASIHLDAIPPKVFDICTPTKGSREIVKTSSGAKWLALDIIHSASFLAFSFSIDEHPIWIYAADGQYIEPMKVDALQLFNGDRYSILVELDKPADYYGIRVASVAAAQLIDTLAYLEYDDCAPSTTNTTNGTYPSITSTPSITRAGGPVSDNITFLDPEKISAYPNPYPQEAPPIAQTIIMSLGMVNYTYIWALNKTPFNIRALENIDPPLLYTTPSANQTGTDADTTITTQNNTWIDLIFTSSNTPPQPPHPIHKHSNKAFIIGQGTGAWNWSTVAEAQAALPQNFNTVNPPYRDGFLVPGADVVPTWLVVRYHVVNPGAILLHCHIQSHLNGGMAMVILDGVDVWPEVRGLGGYA